MVNIFITNNWAVKVKLSKFIVPFIFCKVPKLYLYTQYSTIFTHPSHAATDCRSYFPWKKSITEQGKLFDCKYRNLLLVYHPQAKYILFAHKYMYLQYFYSVFPIKIMLLNEVKYDPHVYTMNSSCSSLSLICKAR